MRLLCAFAAFAIVIQFAQADPNTIVKTEVVILGTIHGAHYENPQYSPEKLKEIILSTKPDAILNELPPSLVDSEGRPIVKIRDRKVSPECWAADCAAQQLGIPQIPYDRPDRQEYYKKTQYFEKQKDANTIRLKFFDDAAREPNSFNCKIVELYQHAYGAERNICANFGPRVINSDVHDEVIRTKMSLWFEIMPALLENNPDYKELVDIDHFFREEWKERNQIMAENIIKTAKQYPGKRLLVLTGATHRYMLFDSLKDHDKIRLGEYWQIEDNLTAKKPEEKRSD